MVVDGAVGRVRARTEVGLWLPLPPLEPLLLQQPCRMVFWEAGGWLGTSARLRPFVCIS